MQRTWSQKLTPYSHNTQPLTPQPMNCAHTARRLVLLDRHFRHLCPPPLFSVFPLPPNSSSSISPLFPSPAMPAVQIAMTTPACVIDRTSHQAPAPATATCLAAILRGRRKGEGEREEGRLACLAILIGKTYGGILYARRGEGGGKGVKGEDSRHPQRGRVRERC